MSLIEQDLGEIRRTGETVELVFRRRYAKPIEKVWAALTVPERLADWFTEVEMEALRPDARLKFDFKEANATAEGRIVTVEPPRAFAWTWRHDDGSESLIRFDLEPDGDGCRLTLTESGLSAKLGHGNACGWHAHLDGLEDAVEGVRTPWSKLLEREKVIRPAYEARISA